MGGGSFSNCPACQKLNLYGATCVCGQRTDMPAPAVPDPTVEARGVIVDEIGKRCGQIPDIHPRLLEGINSAAAILATRATTPDPLRDRLQALCDAAMRNNWHLGAEAVSVTVAQVLAVVGEGRCACVPIPREPGVHFGGISPDPDCPIHMPRRPR